MTFGFIKNQVCINIVEFDNGEIAQNVFGIFIPSECDEIVPCPDGYGIGDRYEDEVWSKPGPSITPPSIEDRVSAIEDALLTIL